MADTKYWAIGMGKYIEVRTHPTTPKRRVSTITVGTSSNMSGYKATDYVIFMGGKVIKAFNAHVFKRKVGVSVPYGEVRLIPLTQMEKLLRVLHNGG